MGSQTTVLRVSILVCLIHNRLRLYLFHISISINRSEDADWPGPGQSSGGICQGMSRTVRQYFKLPETHVRQAGTYPFFCTNL